MSTSALAEKWGAENDASITSVRTTSGTIEHPDHGPAVIRDRKPIHRESLVLALEGRMSVEEWLAELNSRVFFFGQRESLEGLLRSPSYRNESHDVLIIDMASLVARFGDQIEFTGMNTGFARPHNHQTRGRETFVPLDDYPHRHREVARVGSSSRELVETRSEVLETLYLRSD